MSNREPPLPPETALAGALLDLHAPTLCALLCILLSLSACARELQRFQGARRIPADRAGDDSMPAFNNSRAAAEPRRVAR